MNRTFFSTLTKTAVLAATASMAAFGWDASHLTAKVNFPFKASSADMPAGHYDVNRENVGGTARFYLRNIEAKKQIVLGVRGVDGYDGKDRPSMTFRCTDSGCGLVAINTGTTKYNTQSPKLSASDKERLVTVYFDRVAGE